MSLISISTKTSLQSLALTQPTILIPAVTLSGGGAVTGFVISETTQGYNFSRKLSSWGSQLIQFLSSLTPNTGAVSIPSKWISSIGIFFSTLYSSSQQYLSQAGISTVKALQWLAETSKSFETSMLGDLKHSLNDMVEIKDLFQNLFTKAPNFIKFLTDSSQRQSLTKLFENDKLQKTQEVLKVFSGKKGSFQVAPGVAVYLVKELIKDPKRVSEKIDRFVELIDKARTKIQGEAGSSGAGTGGASGQPYVLTKHKLEDFLTERKEAAQDGWELGFLLEVDAKKQGIELGPLSTSVFAATFDFLDVFSQLNSPKK